jgi:hypothetical protein
VLHSFLQRLKRDRKQQAAVLRWFVLRARFVGSRMRHFNIIMGLGGFLGVKALTVWGQKNPSPEKSIT